MKLIYFYIITTLFVSCSECKPEITFYESGKVKSINEVICNGKDITTYFENGKIQQIQTQLIGDTLVIKTYFEDGQIQNIHQTVNGLKTGEERTWFPNGKIQSKEVFEQGEKVGVGIYFESN